LNLIGVLTGSSALKLENSQLRAELERLKRRLHRSTSEAGSAGVSSGVAGLGSGPALERLTSDLAQVRAKLCRDQARRQCHNTTSKLYIQHITHTVVISVSSGHAKVIIRAQQLDKMYAAEVVWSLCYLIGDFTYVLGVVLMDRKQLAVHHPHIGAPHGDRKLGKLSR
jgi:hypothetical protein